MAKPSLPQGTRDFGPDVVRKRNYIFSTIKNVFELYGFQPLETPAMENLETLMGKYGEEGDKLIYRILDSGNPFSNDFLKAFLDWIEFEEKRMSATPINLFAFLKDDTNRKNVLESENFKYYLNKFKNEVSGKALKYDLTIPFARYIAMNHNKLTFPFRRYQIQPVWRADRPQKGRYREFYQCDADIVGSNSLLNEVELITIYVEVFKRLGINVDIRINNRKILTALAELCGGIHLMNPIATAIDKYDKIGEAGVKDELLKLNLTHVQIDTILKFLTSNQTDLDELEGNLGFLKTNIYGQKGLNEINSVFKFLVENTNIKDENITIDFTLARGLNYYTGIILEIRAKDVKIGSIGGGGRYDDLTGLFGVPNIPGVGISFGVDRIYDVMEELDLFPSDVHVGTQVLFFNLGENESKAAFNLMQQLRNKNIRSELYHENVKFDKQFKYAEKKNIPFAVIIGSKELEENTCTIKNLLQGSQQTIQQQELLNYNF